MRQQEDVLYTNPHTLSLWHGDIDNFILFLSQAPLVFFGFSLPGVLWSTAQITLIIQVNNSKLTGWPEKFSALNIDGKTIGKVFFS
jgi:hypothetical protein